MFAWSIALTPRVAAEESAFEFIISPDDVRS
jgi:hypothetical protein